MFDSLLTSFFPGPIFADQDSLYGTKSDYEFTMYTINVDGLWYAIVENPDYGRLDDMEEVIQEEYGAQILGWCLLSKYRNGKRTMLKHPDTMNYDRVTYLGSNSHGWVLRITKPKQA